MRRDLKNTANLLKEFKMNKIFLTLITSLALSPLWAQEKLSLNDAIRKGLESNYDILIEKRNVDIAENNNSWGEAGRLPKVDLQAREDVNISNQQSDNQFFGGQLFPGYELSDQRSYAFVPSVNLSWTIFQGRRAIINKQRLEDLERESKGNAEIIITNNVQAIVLGYFKVVLEEERLDEYSKQLQLSREKYEYVQLKSSLGTSVTSDVLLEENNYLNDSIDFINQKLIYNNALRDLNFLMAETDVNKKYELTDGLETLEVNWTYTSLSESLNGANLDLRKQYISQAILKENLAIAKGARLPVASMGLGYRWSRNTADLTNANYTGQNDNYVNPPDPLVSRSGVYFANFTVTFSLFDGNRINRAIENAMIQEQVGELKIDKMKNSLQRDLANEYENYLVKNQLFGINNRRFESTETNLELSREKFKNGTINSFDYRTIQNNNLAASIQRLQAIYNVIDSQVSVLRLTGNLLNAFVQ
jgi:outer membrane protein